HVVAAERREGEVVDGGEAELVGEGRVLGGDARERCLLVADHIHLVHGHHDVADAEERGDEGVAPGLRAGAQAGVGEGGGQGGGVGGGGPGGDVGGVRLVPGGVGDDELGALGGEVAVGDVEGDALLALGERAVDEEAVVDLPAGRALLGRVPPEGRELVVVDV